MRKRRQTASWQAITGAAPAWGDDVHAREGEHSLGPAPEMVAPSSEVALRTSKSPPAGAGVLRPAPAVLFALLLGTQS